jgi:hypothetical protein
VNPFAPRTGDRDGHRVGRLEATPEAGAATSSPHVLLVQPVCARLAVEFCNRTALGPADSADMICISGFSGGEGSLVQCGVRRTKYEGPQDDPEGVQWGRWGLVHDPPD